MRPAAETEAPSKSAGIMPLQSHLLDIEVIVPGSIARFNLAAFNVLLFLRKV